MLKAFRKPVFFFIFFIGLLGATLLPAGETTKNPVLQLADVFADHMVLQREAPLPVWGWTTPGQAVKVTLNGQTAEATADASGKWSVTLPAMKVGGPHELVVASSETVTVKDILVGDVWLCSGQSNMGFTVNRSSNAKEDMAAANIPNLRHLSVKTTAEVKPQERVTAKWTVATPETVGGWTAAGFFFGRQLQKDLNIPIGLINSSWGGTRVEAWTSKEALAALGGCEDMLKQRDDYETNYDRYMKTLNDAKKAYEDARKKMAADIKAETQAPAQAGVDFDDAAWKELNSGSIWQYQGYNNVNGLAWYRKVIDIPADWAGKELVLNPGQINQVEMTYFNGVKVGERGSLEPLRNKGKTDKAEYKIPAELVKAGKAVIACRVAAFDSRGGMDGGAKAVCELTLSGDASAKPLSLKGKWKFNFEVRLEPLPDNPHYQNNAAALYNGMINPLLPFPIRGAIWYQGENNAGGGYVYRDRLPAMIKDWRTRWGQEFPFFTVQLANYQAPKKDPTPDGDSWAVIRESQALTLNMPNTGMATAIDVGEANDIHPTDKQTVGYRLAMEARRVAYGETNLVSHGPRYKEMSVEGGKIRIKFDTVGGGLVVKDGGALKRFAIAGADKKFVWADAAIDGDAVVVSSAAVKEPAAVRYAFETNPEGLNLYNKEGFPAEPFRTDDWKVATQK